jgi:hypothetical protein
MDNCANGLGKLRPGLLQGGPFGFSGLDPEPGDLGPISPARHCLKGVMDQGPTVNRIAAEYPTMELLNEY